MNARDIQKNQKTDKAINKNNAVGINISLGSTGWKDQAETFTEETKGSRITAGRTAAVIAKEDIAVKGSTIHAKDIHLKAGNNIHILSSENKRTTIEDYKAKSGSIGAFLSKGVYGIGASYGKGKGQIEETTITHTPSDITAKNTVALSSGNDITIRGGTVKGNKVTANAGRMSIESEQDKKNYKETGKTSGLSISYTPGSAVTVSGGKGKTNTDSTYESVTTQSGLYAGQEGYDIQVKNNTHLKGAVIDSKAPAEKNKLTTGTLTWENIDNKAEYKTKASGITVSTHAVSKLNPLGLGYVPTIPVKGKAGSITYAAIADSIITTTKEKTDKEISHDTANALNTLSEIFDKKKIEEKQELIHMMNIVGNQIIHEAADHYGWKEGSTEKLLLHGAIGALTGSMSGGNALSGAVSGSVNEFALAYMEKTKGRDWMDTHPDTVQAISTALGAVAGSLTGDRNTGAYTAQMGTRWNYFAFADALSPARQMAKTLLQKKDGSPATETEIENTLRNLNRIMTEQEPEKGGSGFLYAENTNSYNKGIAYLKQEGFTQDSAVSLFKEYNRYLRLGVDWKHPVVRLPGIQLDVDKNHKVINSSGTPEIRMPNENNHLESPHAPEEYHPSKFNMGLSVASELVVDKTTELPKTLSEYYGYGGTASKIFFKAGGVVGIGMALNDIQKDSRLYSGWNRYKVITADLAPVIFGTVLGSGGVALGIPIVGGLFGGVLGDYTKEYIKAETPTNKEEEVRKYYQEVKNR